MVVVVLEPETVAPGPSPPKERPKPAALFLQEILQPVAEFFCQIDFGNHHFD